MSPWIIYINLIFKQKALKVSIYIYIYMEIFAKSASGDTTLSFKNKAIQSFDY